MNLKDAVLIKVDKNGSKHWEGMVKCDRCGGSGVFSWGAVINGVPQYGGVCYKCWGNRWVKEKWIERTPEYQAKLDAKREAKLAEKRKIWEAEAAKREEERKAREAKEAEEKAKRDALKKISQYVGEVGEKVSFEVEYLGSARYERRSFGGFGLETAYFHKFKDACGNKVIWNSGAFVDFEEGEKVVLKGIVKDHKEYDGEKQTYVKNCRFSKEGKKVA